MTGAMGFIRRLINRVWWGEGWAQDEEPYVEPDTVTILGLGSEYRVELPGVRVGDMLALGPGDTVVPANGGDNIIGHALEDFEYSASDGAWCGKAIL